MTVEGAPFYHDNHFWVAVGFGVFISAFIKFIYPLIAAALDKRGADIAHQLEQANRLRAEAEALLNASKIQQEVMLKEAAAILEQAELDAKQILDKAASDLEQTVARRMAIADEKIARAQSNAMNALRSQMIEVATETTRHVITERLKGQPDDPAIARALESISRSIH